MKDSSRFNSELPFVGVLLGALFPIIAIALDLTIKDMSLNLDNIRELFASNRLQWIVLMAPFVLGGVFYYLGELIQRRETQLNIQIEQEKEQFKILGNIVLTLNQRNLQTTTSDLHASHETKGVIDALNKFKAQYHNDRDAEQQQQWIMTGFNELNTILTTKENLDILMDRIIKFLVKYINYNQGSFFTHEKNGSDSFLMLKACYAYDRKKFVEQRIEIGEGFIGQCFLEKSRIMLHDVPKDYIKITSGLGESRPTSIVIVPLSNHDTIVGVVEMAGFRKLKAHELQFIDKAAENIGNMLSNLKTSERTQLLLEESQSQSEQMKEQEEEMRQSIEELAATEEEMKRKESGYIKKIERLENDISELMRLDWENKHKIESLQASLDGRGGVYEVEKSLIKK